MATALVANDALECRCPQACQKSFAAGIVAAPFPLPVVEMECRPGILMIRTGERVALPGDQEVSI